MLRSDIRNDLLASLPSEAWELLHGKIEPIDLPRDFQIGHIDQAIAYHYFPEVGIASMVAVSSAGERAEIGIVGREGVTPLAAMAELGHQPFEFMIQVPGRGHRIRREDLRCALAESHSLKMTLDAFALRLFTQTAYTALSNAVHHVDTRLARWILMIDDRVDGNRIDVTHEFLAVMLAVRRSGVTNAIHILEGEHLIYADRGLVTIRDRAALEVFAGAAYGSAERISLLNTPAASHRNEATSQSYPASWPIEGGPRMSLGKRATPGGPLPR
ncbi:Crp/Fnr family transcriptional regulator [Rhizobium laguerreae]|uniref:Crp/Fnr family transcriptional regulator n=1 Tax=Rhizobium laguerreae TaxID=1076926 RepID=UPI001C91E6D9|nr:Crp/Fnr family transcriptional regulator [Rhizobium laguerreae]MBY3465793.1 Crp/Fnr family transcriptional regulator [Rhizobium laguerreae]